MISYLREPYHCDYLHVDDLVVVVQVVARSSDFDQPHPHNLPHNHPPRHQQQEPQKYQQQHQQFGQTQEEHGSLGGGLFRDVEVVVVWLHLRKDRFPDLRKSKLMPRADGCT